MTGLYGHIVETDEILNERFNKKTTVHELLEKVIVNEKWDCSVDKLSLYFARKNDKRLSESEPEMLDLFQGKLSDGLKKIISDTNRIDPDTLVRTFNHTCGTYTLLEAPPRIRRRYRKSVVETRRRLIGHLAAKNADLDSFDELSWWERLSSYILPPKVDKKYL
ncbi:hypothetical protein V7S43_003893 [Phytophthora oleae]|uniref:RXLR phytopathogen effector protein WY-domain domain-containing protein n=1 Tax=Phytophthora oleae TaxID=2107226 RepID=A0ABD3FY76_9STRA